MTLYSMGWNDFFKNSYDALADETLTPARVTSAMKNSFRVSNGRDEFLSTLAGRLYHAPAATPFFPATGDWVTLRGTVITGVLPRKNALSRGASGNRAKQDAHPSQEQVIAANIDTVFIVCGLDRDYNIRRIERYLTLVYNSGCTPEIILNKVDLHPDIGQYVDEVNSVAFGVPVHPVSAKQAIGTEALSRCLSPGTTVALVGSSGVGKSTLVNHLAGDERRITREISDYDGKGIHTTTSRDLIQLPGGGLIIDNPGIREIAFWDDDGGLDVAFPDIEAWSRECRFSDCSHEHEPTCRVKEAVRTGELSRERLNSFLKLKRELVFLSERQEKSADRIEKERWKSVALKVKEIKKRKER